MTARSSSSPGSLEFELADGACIRMTLTPFAVVGELTRNGVRVTLARFPNFAAAGRWIDAELRLAAFADEKSPVRELFAP